jgi:hypothetical protein
MVYSILETHGFSKRAESRVGFRVEIMAGELPWP